MVLLFSGTLAQEGNANTTPCLIR